MTTKNMAVNSENLKETIMVQLRFSELSAPRRAFIRKCQQMGFGKILGLVVCDGDPVFGPRTEVLLDVKLDTAEMRRPEQDLSDFVLGAAIMRLFAKLDAIRNGDIQQGEIRDGLPVRMSVKTTVQE